MAQKKLENATTWKCDKGCLNTKRACKHLEKLLPNIDRSQIRISYRKDMDNFDTFENSSASLRKDEIYAQRRLKELGLNSREIGLFSGKYLDGFTLEDLLKQYPEYNNISNIHYAIRQIKRKLKEKLSGKS